MFWRRLISVASFLSNFETMSYQFDKLLPQRIKGLDQLGWHFMDLCFNMFCESYQKVFTAIAETCTFLKLPNDITDMHHLCVWGRGEHYGQGNVWLGGGIAAKKEVHQSRWPCDCWDRFFQSNLMKGRNSLYKGSQSVNHFWTAGRIKRYTWKDRIAFTLVWGTPCWVQGKGVGMTWIKCKLNWEMIVIKKTDSLSQALL